MPKQVTTSLTYKLVWSSSSTDPDENYGTDLETSARIPLPGLWPRLLPAFYSLSAASHRQGRSIHRRSKRDRLFLSDTKGHPDRRRSVITDKPLCPVLCGSAFPDQSQRLTVSYPLSPVRMADGGVLNGPQPPSGICLP